VEIRVQALQRLLPLRAVEVWVVGGAGQNCTPEDTHAHELEGADSLGATLTFVVKVWIGALILTVAAIACTRVVPGGHFACGEADCPPGMQCAADGLCYWNTPLDSGQPPGVDAPPDSDPDAAPPAPDAAPSAPDAAPPAPDAAPPPPDAAVPPVDCSGIAADPDYELCEEDADHCAGVYNDGSGCVAYCAAAGLVCTARFGGQPDCVKEPDYVIDCFEVNTHLSDWCECRRP